MEFVEKYREEWWEFGNKSVYLHPNNINLVRNVAGVSASDDDLHFFGGSTGTLPHTKAVTLCRCENTNQTNLQEFIKSHRFRTISQINECFHIELLSQFVLLQGASVLKQVWLPASM